MLLIQELIAPVFIGLEADLRGKNRHFFAFQANFQVKTELETGSKTAFLAVFSAHLGLKPNQSGRKQLFFI